MALWKPILSIIRWRNLLLLAFVQIVIYFRLVNASVTVMTLTDLVLLVIITMLIGASGYAINDYYDHQIDAHNRPETVVAGRLMSLSAIRKLYWVICLIGGFLSIWLALRLRLWPHVIIYPLAIAALWWYSYALKCQPITGNLLVALFCGGVVLIVGAPDWFKQNRVALSSTIFSYGVFAFLSTWFREVVKDLEDKSGDAREQCQTLVVRYGITAGKIVATILGLLFLISILLWEDNTPLIRFRFLFTILQGFTFAAVLFVVMAKNNVYFHYASQMIKWIMAGGTLILFIS